MDGADELAWETLATETDYTCPGFDVAVDDVRLPDGTEGEYHYVSEPPSVVVLPFTTDGDVVVIEEWRQAVGRVNYGLPAGGLENEDADPAAAARRELAEETGYEAGHVRHLCSFYTTPGICTERMHVYLAAELRHVGQSLEAGEKIEVELVEMPRLLEMLRGGQVEDGKTLATILYYSTFGTDP